MNFILEKKEQEKKDDVFFKVLQLYKKYLELS